VTASWRIARDVLARTEHHRYGRHRQNRADLLVPLGDGPHPVVILIHGGSWRATYGKVVMKPLAADLVRRGYATWNIEYRRIGRGQGGGWPMTFDDVAAAIDYLGELRDPRLDLGDVTLLGHSAGGHLALWATTREDAIVRARRVIAMAPVADLASAQMAHALMGGTPQALPERYARANPLELLPAGVPMLLVHGAEDATISVEHSRRYAEAARAAGDEVGLIEPRPGGHRSHIDPRSAGWRAVIEWLEEARRSTSPPAAR
jgi:acetyl esterase/lipase